MVLPVLPGLYSTDYNETWLLTLAIALLIPETAHAGNEPTLVSSTFHKRRTGERAHSPTGGCSKPLLVQEHSCTKDDVGDRGPALSLRKQKCHYVRQRWIKTFAVLRRDSMEVVPGNMCPALPSPGEVFLGEPGQKFSIFSLPLHFPPLLFIEGFHEKLLLLFCQILPSGIASIISKKFVISLYFSIAWL